MAPSKPTQGRASTRASARFPSVTEPKDPTDTPPPGPTASRKTASSSRSMANLHPTKKSKTSKGGARALSNPPDVDGTKIYLDEEEVDRRIQSALAVERTRHIGDKRLRHNSGGQLTNPGFNIEDEVARQVKLATQRIQARADQELANALNLRQDSRPSTSSYAEPSFQIPKLGVTSQETEVETDNSDQADESDSESGEPSGDFNSQGRGPESSSTPEKRGKRDPHPPPASFWQDNISPPRGMAPIAGNERNYGAVKSRLRQETDRLKGELRQNRFPTCRVAVHNRVLTTHLEEVTRVLLRAKARLGCVSCTDPLLKKVECSLEQVDAGLAVAKRATIHEEDVARLADSHGMAVVTASEAMTSVTKGLAERSQFVLKQLKQAEVDAVTLSGTSSTVGKNGHGGSLNAIKKRAKKPGKAVKSTKCFNCQGYGHLARDCKAGKA